MAAGHDHGLREPAHLDVGDPDRPLLHVLEVRHPTFADNPALLEQLRRHDVGIDNDVLVHAPHDAMRLAEILRDDPGGGAGV